MKHTIKRFRWLTVAIAAAALLSASGWASATPIRYVTQFTTLNGSGVTGSAVLTLNDGHLLTVDIKASGLAKNEPHDMHIHGPLNADGAPTQATIPTTAMDDTNHDDVIEMGEGMVAFGQPILPLVPFPKTPNGTLDFSYTYDLNAGIYSSGFKKSDLLPLNLRAIVLHGMAAPRALWGMSMSGMGGTGMGGMNMNAMGDMGGPCANATGKSMMNNVCYAMGEYDPMLPVAIGVLAVPEPADLGMLSGGLALLLGLLWLRRKRDLRGMDA